MTFTLVSATQEFLTKQVDAAKQRRLDEEKAREEAERKKAEVSAGAIYKVLYSSRGAVNSLLMRVDISYFSVSIAKLSLKAHCNTEPTSTAP